MEKLHTIRTLSKPVPVPAMTGRYTDLDTMLNMALIKNHRLRSSSDDLLAYLLSF